MDKSFAFSVRPHSRWIIVEYFDCTKSCLCHENGPHVYNVDSAPPVPVRICASVPVHICASYDTFICVREWICPIDHKFLILMCRCIIVHYFCGRAAFECAGELVLAFLEQPNSPFRSCHRVGQRGGTFFVCHSRRQTNASFSNCSHRSRFFSPKRITVIWREM